MATPSTIHLQAPVAGSDDPRKLNLFEGRALSEREFELLQAYVDDRVQPLAGLLPPGITAGLTVSSEGSGADTWLTIHPGRGSGAGGRLVRLFNTLQLAWQDVVDQAEQEQDADLRDGFYFLTLRPVVEQIEPPDDRPPGTRTEVDPLRERRHEVVSLPGLQWITGNPRWLAMSPTRAANRVGVAMLDSSPFNADTGALPLALLAVKNRAPLWIDPVAGRYLAEPDSRYRTFLARSVIAWQDWAKRRTAASLSLSRPVATRISVAGATTSAAIPAAITAAVSGPIRKTNTAAITRAGNTPALTASLVAVRSTLPISASALLTSGSNLTSVISAGPVFGDATTSAVTATPPRLADALELDYLPAAGPFGQALLQGAASAQPSLAFVPGDLQVELAPVPASTVQDVIEAELPRGTVDLVHLRGDRIRLLLAIPDLDFRHDLLDLPSRDLALEDELFARYNAADTSWATWRSLWQALFGTLNDDALKKHQAPALISPPLTPDSVRNGLVDTRIKTLVAGETLPEPYTSHQQHPHAGAVTPVAPDISSEGLLAELAKVQLAIASTEAALAEGYGLINEVSDFLGLQRQHLDSLTVSFSALAGGVAGDGAGMNLTRWATTATLLPKAAAA
jgi:hypothetical protein